MLGSAAAVSLVVTAGALAAVGTGRDGDQTHAAAVDSAQPVPFELYASAWGLRVGVQQRYDEDRDLTGGQLVTEDGTDTSVSFWYRRFDEHYPAPDPFPVKAGSEVLVENTLQPDCAGPAGVPVLVITSRSADGEEHRDAYRPDDEDVWRETVEAYCRLDPELMVAGSTQSPDDSFTVTLTILNPTAEPVEVVSEGFTEGSTTWEPGSTTVPPHGNGELVLTGDGEGCSSVNPWTTGRVTLDGVVPDLDEAYSEQC